jgi:glycosyltransferase involved in cell wall biosynthesis
MKLTIVIPAYNEEKTLGKVIEQIPKEIDSITNLKIIVVDDGSTDKTSEIAKKHGAEVYSFTKNRGLAKAISKSFSLSIQNNSDFMIILDADNQYDPSEIPLLLKPVLENKADIVLGDRQVKTLDHMPIQKRIGNQISSKVLSSLIGLNIKDAQTGFRAFNKEALEKLQIFPNYTYTQETLMQAKYKGLKIVEIPVKFRKRDDESRLISNIFSYASRTISLIASTIIFYKSFKIFAIITLVLFGISMGLSVFILNHFYETGTVKPYYVLATLTVMFIITGSVSALMAMISSILHRQSTMLEEVLYYLKKTERNQENS